jgi:AmiR/NasT family two-component response regulator
VFAARASIALMHADQVFNLRRAVATRQQIGQAVGILMERHKIDEDTAFERLVTASQQAHVKIRDIAARISQTGEEPEEVTT